MKKVKLTFMLFVLSIAAVALFGACEKLPDRVYKDPSSAQTSTSSPNKVWLDPTQMGDDSQTVVITPLIPFP